MRQNEQKLKDWIDDVLEKIIEAESIKNDKDEWLFDKIPAKTVEDVLALLCRVQIYINKISEMKSELLQDESNPSQTVKRIIEKFEEGRKGGES